MGMEKYFIMVVLCVSLAAVKGVEEENPGANCNCDRSGQQTTSGYKFPHVYNDIPTSNENPASGNDQWKSTNHQQQPYFMPVAPMVYMVPQMPVHAVKGQKGEPGETKVTHPLGSSEKDVHLKEDPSLHDQGSLRSKGDKGDRGLTGPRGYRGERGPPCTSTDCNKKTNDIQQDGTQHQSQVKVAFTVAFTNNIGPTVEPLTLKFEHVTTNIGDGYNTTNGEFSAPVSGLYVFTYHILSQHSKPTEVGLKHNTKMVNYVHSRETGGYTGVSNTAILHLEKGDVVTLVLSPGIYYVYGVTGHHTTFSGDGYNKQMESSLPLFLVYMFLPITF